MGEHDEYTTLLTGVTGFVGRFVLLELLRSQTPSLAVVIRTVGRKSAQQRWADEIMGSSLFAPYSQQLRTVRVIDASLEQIETTSHQLRSVRTLIHCAANVKHYDPYALLERDNVGNVERVLKLAESLHVQHLVLLSTCYVHPRAGAGAGGAGVRTAERIVGNPKQSDFYNDYCYTKWRGEEAVFAADTHVPNITIARLSCVGAPTDWELAAHPCAAQAHLGILSLALRGFLETLAWRPNARISTIPVDIVAREIVGLIKEPEGESEGIDNKKPTPSIRITQLCAPPEITAYHISLPLLVSTLQNEYGLEDFRGLTRTDSTGLHLSWWKQVAYACMSRGQQALTLHNHVQDFVSTFTDEDIRFESSIASDGFPALSELEIARGTCEYAVRILHHRQLAKGVPATLLDRFWHRLGNREPVQVCFKLAGNGVEKAEWPALARRLWAFFMSQRKYTAGLSNVEPKTWSQHNGHSISTYFGEATEITEGEGSILTYGLRQSVPERLWHITPISTSKDGSTISHILLRVDHAITDGVGAVATLPGLARHVFQEDATGGDTVARFHRPRTLSLWMDIWMGIVYVALLFVTVLGLPVAMDSGKRSYEPTVATATIARGQGKSPNGHTFTTNILWRLTQLFTATTRESTHLFAVPAVTSTFRPAKNMPANAFVPVLVPVESGMTEEAFAHRCMLLRSRSVRFISWCIVHLLEWMVAEGRTAHYGSSLMNMLLSKIRCEVSSLQTGNLLPKAVASVHVVTTTPTPVPYCVTTVTNGDQVFITARSHDPMLGAERIVDALKTDN